ncbi:MAG: FAD-binding oxidoreductase [Pseudomonadales bacterium]|jgi:FAD/FMN-containing dehydrogenase|nr:FAD-binding oxidoreductase [Pseudomonadales bacterium]MDP7359049.1 FAD-binding oxidoreductase [Pseudomonadales bacterium]HJN52156.1 FAD-binding oxidoreductase [Pseudomonadales bacterium]|tara:strand:- start:524 stop:2044 length:1521 start_codon:yes stop_codon:yes gene_type:complete
MNSEQLHAFARHLESEGISFEVDDTTAFMSDASFLSLGKPGLVIFAKSEDEVLSVVGFAAKNAIPLTPRAKGSSTAGAAIAPAGQVLLMTDMLGVVNRFGKRLGKREISFYTADGTEVPPQQLQDFSQQEVYARVGAGLSTGELDSYLTSFGWHTAVVPSSGWSTIGGNFSTNAGGNGTPKYGTFKQVINRIKLITSSDNDAGAEVKIVTDRDTIVAMGGGQGLFGIIIELDVRIVPDLEDAEICSVICYSTTDDIETLGDSIGAFMADMQEVCDPEIAEFMMVDSGIFTADDPLLHDPEIAPLFDYPDDQYRMLTMYLGQQAELQALRGVADQHDGINYVEVSHGAFTKMLDLRKAATGKSPGRVALPGFEDIYIKDPNYLGKVLKAIFTITAGRLPGRPIGHQYTGGVVVHYRPQVKPTRSEYSKGWQLTQELNREICSDTYQTVKRQEHGLGLEVYSLASPAERDKIIKLKEQFDPANIFQPHFITETPTVNFIGAALQGLKA